MSLEIFSKKFVALVILSLTIGGVTYAESTGVAGEDLRNAQMFMKLLGVQSSQEKDVQQILLKSMKKRAKAYKKMRRVNGRPGEAFEDLKKIQKRERKRLKSILSPTQLSLYDGQIKKNRATFFGKSSKAVPGVMGGQGGGYRNEDKTTD